MLMTHLPESITLKDGTVLDHVIGYIAGLAPSKGELIRRAKERGARYRCVEVLSRRLRVRNDLRGKPYTPSTWIFSDQDLRLVVAARKGTGGQKPQP